MVFPPPLPFAPEQTIAWIPYFESYPVISMVIAFKYGLDSQDWYREGGGGLTSGNDIGLGLWVSKSQLSDL